MWSIWRLLTNVYMIKDSENNCGHSNQIQIVVVSSENLYFTRGDLL